VTILMAENISSSRYLGPISLGACVVGMVATEALIHTGMLANPWWRVVAMGFEAGTVGAMADWFAVSALFRDVPIPILRRHTNIIAKNRTRIVENLKGYVQTKLLTPAAIREKLSGVSFCKAAMAYMNFNDNRAKVNDVVRNAMSGLIKGLDKDEVVEFLENAARERLLNLDITKPLGSWIINSIESGDHGAIWDAVLDECRKLLHEKKVELIFKEVIENGVEKAKNEGWHKSFALWVGEKSGSVNYDVYADKLVESVIEWIDELKGNSRSPLRSLVDNHLLTYAKAMASGLPDAVQAVEGLKSGIIAKAELDILIKSALSQMKAAATSQLNDSGSQLSQMLQSMVEDMFEHLRTDHKLQVFIDEQLREAICSFITKNHNVIGDIVESSLSPDKISDKELVSQIEVRIGGDLQYIRLNGAIVGGMVGALIMTIKIAFGIQ